jgi:hypothetical protein
MVTIETPKPKKRKYSLSEAKALMKERDKYTTGANSIIWLDSKTKREVYFTY